MSELKFKHEYPDDDEMRIAVVGLNAPHGLNFAIDNEDYYDPQRASFYLNPVRALELRDWLNKESPAEPGGDDGR